MAELDDVRRLALALPEVEEGLSWGTASWKVRGRLFVWERPLGRADLEALGAGAPRGPVVGVRVADLADKEALLQTEPQVVFTTPHFDGFPALLVQLDRVGLPLLEELVVDAWRARAPRRLAAQLPSPADGSA